MGNQLQPDYTGSSCSVGVVLLIVYAPGPVTALPTSIACESIELILVRQSICHVPLQPPRYFKISIGNELIRSLNEFLFFFFKFLIFLQHLGLTCETCIISYGWHFYEICIPLMSIFKNKYISIGQLFYLDLTLKFLSILFRNNAIFKTVNLQNSLRKIKFSTSNKSIGSFYIIQLLVDSLINDWKHDINVTLIFNLNLSSPSCLEHTKLQVTVFLIIVKPRTKP